MINNPEAVNILFLGGVGVGKQLIISRYCYGLYDSSNSIKPLPFYEKTIEYNNFKKSLKFQIFNTPGHEKYHSLVKTFYRNAKIIIFVYDITRKTTFDEIKNYWYEDVKIYGKSDVIFAIVASKSDLDNEKEISDEEGKKFADSINAVFQSVSAKLDKGINDLFFSLGQKYIELYSDDNKKSKENKGKLDRRNIENQNNKKCVIF